MKKFKKKYPIHFYHVGVDKKLNLFGLMNMIQDLASDHAQILGFGHEQLDQDTYWVLVRQKIQMDYWPRWQEEIELETFIAHSKIGTPPRDLLIYYQGQIIGRGQTSWLVVDGKTRKVAAQKIDLLLEASVEESSGIKTEKVQLPAEGLELYKTFVVELSDLDMNFHVNNAIYGQWVSNCLDEQLLQGWEIQEFSINYLQEILHQNEVKIRRKVTLDSDKKLVYLEGRVGEESKAAFAALVRLIKKV